MSSDVWVWRAGIAAVAAMTVAYSTGLYSRSGPPSQPAAAATSSPGQAALNESFAHFQAGRYREAIQSAQTVIAADPNLAAGAYNNMAVAYLKLGDFAAATKAAED